MRKWNWQTWNKLNIGHWRGSQDEFFKLHDHAIKAVPTSPTARIEISSQLRDTDGAFAVIARYPEFANTPIVIGKSDPEGCAA